MPAGEDTIRSRYYQAGRSHPNRRTKKKTGFEGNNWPSTRTFYSDISLDVVALSKRMIYYLYRSELYERFPRQKVPVFLEEISRDIGYYVSNYTISGMLNEKWGPRHNPTQKTKIAINKLCEWLERYCKKINRYKPFTFRLHQSDLVHPTENTTHEIENQIQDYRKARRKKGRRQKEILRAHQQRDEAVYPRTRRNEDDSIVGVFRQSWHKVQG